MPEEFDITISRKIAELERKIEKLEAQQGRQMMSPAAGITRTVGTGKDFTTIQAAINWFSGRQFSNSPCTIAIDPGTYTENIALSRLDTASGEELVIRGDTRAIAGMTFCGGNVTATAWSASTAISAGAVRRATTGGGKYGIWMVCRTAGTTGSSEPSWAPGAMTDGSVNWVVFGIDINPTNISNCGSGWCAITSSGSTITVTGSTTNPNFVNAGVVAGDKVLIRDGSGTNYYQTVQSVSGNTITLTTSAPTLSGHGIALTICPNVIINPSSGTVVLCNSSCTLRGLMLMPTGSNYALVNNALGRPANIIASNLTAYNTGTNVFNVYIQAGNFYSSAPSVSLWGAGGLAVEDNGTGFAYHIRIFSNSLWALFVTVNSFLNAPNAIINVVGSINAIYVIFGSNLWATWAFVMCVGSRGGLGITCYTNAVMDFSIFYNFDIGVYCSHQGISTFRGSTVSACLCNAGFLATNGGFISVPNTSTLAAGNGINYVPASSWTPDARLSMIEFT